MSYLVDEPLRRYVEREVNQRLKGYTASIHRLNFHLIGFSWDLDDVVLVQDANPDPPVMRIKQLSASVQWWALTGEAVATLKGRFMGSGAAAVKAVFRPEVKGPDFEIDARIENTDMKTMNDLLRAHGNVDVVSGLFSVFTEIRVKDGRVNGYVKPLFRDLDVFDRTQDADKKFGQKLKERAIDVVAKIFKNRKRDEVATVADISGPLENPKASPLQVVVNLVKNAFVKAILPGFESSARLARSARSR